MTREEMKNKVAEAINGKEVKYFSGSARGYNPVGYYQCYAYSGRYGRGLKIEHPNKEGLDNGHYSNRYYKVTYIIFD